MASKLPCVVPIRIKSGLVYNLIMMAFKKGLKVRYLSKYLQASMSLSVQVQVESFKIKLKKKKNSPKFFRKFKSSKQGDGRLGKSGRHNINMVALVVFIINLMQ